MDHQKTVNTQCFSNIINLVDTLGMYKTRRRYVFILVIIISVTITSIVLNQYSQQINNVEFNRNYQDKYSKWPNFSIAKFEESIKCFQDTNAFSIGSFEEIFTEWKRNVNDECRDLYKTFMTIYTVKLKQNTYKMSDNFKSKIIGWLGNNRKLVDVAGKQVISIFISLSEYKQEFDYSCGLEVFISLVVTFR
jgi:hypothetical protein